MAVVIIGATISYSCANELDSHDHLVTDEVKSLTSLKAPLPYDNNKAITTLQFLSVDIGPRAQGTVGEKTAADYLYKTFASFGYIVNRQNFQVPSSVNSIVELQISNKNIESSAFF